MKELSDKLKSLIWIILTISIFALGFGFYFLFKKVDILSEKVDKLDFLGGNSVFDKEQKATIPSVSSLECGLVCQNEIAEAVSGAMATISGSSKEKVTEKTTVVTQTSGGTSYVTLGSTTSTVSTNWIDVEDSGVYIDLENDYGGNATVSWEASLKIAHGNGKAYARLYDDTNKIAVDFSEISSTDNADFVLVSTGNLPFWRGRNLYKAQIKSLNSFEVTYSGGKLRISY